MDGLRQERINLRLSLTGRIRRVYIHDYDRLPDHTGTNAELYLLLAAADDAGGDGAL